MIYLTLKEQHIMKKALRRSGKIMSDPREPVTEPDAPEPEDETTEVEEDINPGEEKEEARGQLELKV